MQTLGKQITQNFFLNEDGFTQLQERWSEAVQSKDTTLTSQHHLLYQVLRGKNWQKGFTEITNANKIKAGMSRDCTIRKVFDGLYYKTQPYEHPVFKGLIAPDTRTLVKELTIGVLGDSSQVYKDSVEGAKTMQTV